MSTIPQQKEMTDLVKSGKCPSRCGGSSSLSSCPSCSGSGTAGSASAPPRRSDTRPSPPGCCWPPCRRPRTASWCGTWCCTPAPADTARWPARSPAERPRRAGSPARNTTHLEAEFTDKIKLQTFFKYSSFSYLCLICLLMCCAYIQFVQLDHVNRSQRCL